MPFMEDSSITVKPEETFRRLPVVVNGLTVVALTDIGLVDFYRFPKVSERKAQQDRSCTADLLGN